VESFSLRPQPEIIPTSDLQLRGCTSSRMNFAIFCVDVPGRKISATPSSLSLAICIGNLNTLFGDGSYIPEPASRQAHECLVKIAVLLPMLRAMQRSVWERGQDRS